MQSFIDAPAKILVQEYSKLREIGLRGVEQGQ